MLLVRSITELKRKNLFARIFLSSSFTIIFSKKSFIGSAKIDKSLKYFLISVISLDFGFFFLSFSIPVYKLFSTSLVKIFLSI